MANLTNIQLTTRKENSWEGKKTMGITSQYPLRLNTDGFQIRLSETIPSPGVQDQRNDCCRCIFSVTPAPEVSRGRQHQFQKEILIPTNPSHRSRDWSSPVIPFCLL
ncbi:hypothetical protein F2Q70_00030322 [Brassica cretica]|uniref:Uncharacterized protein n=1 Tax=Brassica cretica TaxID=69181 RepID=A0A8S9FJF7_BRACR|nr:hypothetical protein F2Q70_00030322 [Brassica cretica]